MNVRSNKRFLVVGGIVVITIIVILAVIGGGTTKQNMTVAQAGQPSAIGKKVQVTGNVVDNSYSIADDVLTFSIYDASDPGATLTVRYDQGVSATFGNGVTAICSGTIDSSGVLQCSELVTKCPSKYETATNALSVARLRSYGAEILGKPVKVTGVLKAGTLADASSSTRFVLVDADDAAEMNVAFSGAIPDGIGDSSSLVITGSLAADGTFTATDVALEG